MLPTALPRDPTREERVMPAHVPVSAVMIYSMFRALFMILLAAGSASADSYGAVSGLNVAASGLASNPIPIPGPTVGGFYRIERGTFALDVGAQYSLEILYTRENA